MRKIFVTSFFVWLALLQLGCWGKSDNNNSASSSEETIVITNSNVQPTPLPVFPDAETAFAEGDKLFDANKTELAIEA